MERIDHIQLTVKNSIKQFENCISTVHNSRLGFQFTQCKKNLEPLVKELESLAGQVEKEGVNYNFELEALEKSTDLDRIEVCIHNQRHLLERYESEIADLNEEEFKFILYEEHIKQIKDILHQLDRQLVLY